MRRFLTFLWRLVPNWLRPFLTPAQPATIRPNPDADEYQARYIRSFLVMRLVIGGLAVGLPFALILLDRIAFDGDPFPRGSMSVYYYSGMREVFTVTIGTMAFFLFTYRILEKNLDNTLSMIAGLAGLLIPLFPTGRPDALAEQFPLTDLQKLITPDWTKYVHYSASAVFIGSLGFVALLFGRREGERDDRRATLFSPTFWRWYHYSCAGAVGAAAAWIIATSWFIDAPYWSLLLGEAVASLAFGASWFAKGFEIQYLLGKPEKLKAPATVAAPGSV